MRATLRLYRSALRTAILHQGGHVPAINGVVKPFKPGGYQDSGADLAYNLSAKGEDVAFPVDHPRPEVDADWSFPDTIAGVRQAVEEKGVSVLWANTTLHSRHALVDLRDELAKRKVRLVGQNPLDTERFEDKEWINRWLAKQPGLTRSFPASALLTAHSQLRDLPIQLPLVLKPVRGRGSHGVTLVRSEAEYQETLGKLLKESDAVLCEQYLAGQEITVTVMPPGDYEGVGRKDSYWALPVVERFNHQNGIAPYNGVVAVTQNSRVLSPKEHEDDPAYPEAQRACEHVAALCKATAPIRIDCRRAIAKSPILLFDVNMKPNATGPGRPGREQQASLTTMAAEAIGWDYPTLITNILRQAKPIEEVIRS